MKKSDIDNLTNRWLEAGAITPEQAKYISSDVEQYISEASGGKFITALMYIGALALSSGVLLVISSNWNGFSDATKLLLAILLPVVPLIYAYVQLMIKQNLTVLARVANIFGVVLVGGSIAIIEQTYHMQSSIPNTLWLWCLLIVPFLFVFKRVENVASVALLSGTALLFSLFELFEKSRMEDSTILLMLTVVVIGYLAFLYSIGSALRNSVTWLSGGRFLRIISGTIAVVVLYLMTFEFYAREITNSGYHYNDISNTWMTLSIVLNLAFIGFLLFTLLRAVKYEEYHFAFWVVRVTAIYLLTKYVTLFSEMMDTGLFFILGGLIFVFGGRALEKNKKVLVEYMRKAHVDKHNPYRPNFNSNTYVE